MLFYTIAIAALAGQVVVVVAEGARKPYEPALARMSVKSMLLGKRQDDGGYEPDTTLCGTGTTCADACGAGFEQCASTDAQVHCYNAGSSQTCCPNNTGDSCDAGYYCSASTAGDTYCCPNESSLEDCAAAFSVSGGLSSQISLVTSYSTLPGTITITSTSTIVTTSTVAGTGSSTTSAPCTTYTTDIVHTISSNTTFVGSTGYSFTSSTPAAATSPVQAGASSLRGSAIVVVAAVAFAALL